MTIPPNRITRDDLYPWRVWGSDHGLLTGYVDCEFEVDSRAPGTPVVTSTDYPATGGPHGSVGRTGTFTFNVGTLTGRNNTMDVRRYGWSLNDDTAITHSVAVQSSDGTATVPVTATKAGLNTLYVTAFDRTGNRSTAGAVYVFNVEVAPRSRAWSRRRAPCVPDWNVATIPRGPFRLVRADGRGGPDRAELPRAEPDFDYDGESGSPCGVPEVGRMT